MKLAKFRLPTGQERIGILEDDELRPLALAGQYQSLTDILESDDPGATANFLIDDRAPRLAVSGITLLAPLDDQEVWAAGVTYRRSRVARMEESQGAESFYDKVYEAPRPELFFKATPHRVSGPDQPVRVRQDSKWSVPEPELALVLNSRLNLVGFTIGNDMSARDIEGENPLYLPQAKLYNSCCGLGPCVTLRDWMPTLEHIGISVLVRRRGTIAFEGATDVGQMARTFDDLIGYLGRDNAFPAGAILLTGTGIVPPNEFTLADGDEVEITIEGIGTLCNPVVQG